MRLTGVASTNGGKDTVNCMSIVRTEHYTTLHCTSADILFLSPSFNTEEEEVRESPTKALAVAAQECKMAAVSDTAHTHTSTAATSLPLGLAMLDSAVIVGVVSGFKGLSLLQSWKLYARPALYCYILRIPTLSTKQAKTSIFTEDWLTLTPKCNNLALTRLRSN